MEVEGNCAAETSADLLHQVRDSHLEPVIVIWDNGPAHRGDVLQICLTISGLGLRLVPLPGYSPDFDADEASWDWDRDDVWRRSV